MAQTVKGTIGDQPVELINAATESTLAAMLAIAKQDSAVLRAMAAKANVDAKAIEKASKAMEQNSKQAGSAGNSLGETASKASLLGGFLMDMGGAAVKTMGNLVNFGDELMEGKARASDLFKAFKDLPLGLGLLATVFEKVMKYQEKNLDIYQAISGTGAGLNGSLSGLRTQASSLYLTMDELASMYKKNSDIFLQLGGSATSGSKALLGINQNLQRNFGPELSNLGYSFTEINDMLGNYLRVSNDGMRADKNSADEQARLAKAAANYGKELDFMSRLTGENRESLEKKMQAEAGEASWQAHLAGLDEKGREKANMALMRANAIGGKGAMDSLKASIMGFAAPFSEEGKTFYSMMGKGQQAIEGLAGAVKDGTSVEASKTIMNKLQAAGIAGVIKDMKGYGNIVAAAGQGGTEAAKGLMEIQGIVNKYTASGKVNQEQIEAEIAQVIAKTEQDKKASDAANATERRMKELGNQINTALMPIMDLLAAQGNKIVIKFTDFIKEVDFKKLGDDIAYAMNAIFEYAKNLLSEDGRNKIINDLKTLLKQMLIEIQYALDPFYTESNKKRDELKLDLNKKYIDAKTAETIATEEYNQKVKRLREAEFARDNKLQLEKDQKEAEAVVKELKGKKDLNDEQKKALEDANATIKNSKEALAKAMSPEELKKGWEQSKSMYSNVLDLNKATNAAAAEYNQKVVGQTPTGPSQMAETSGGAVTGMPNRSRRDTGSYGATGQLLEDFGAGTLMELHGKEGVITEKQLTALIAGASGAGNSQAQNALANALMALNKQQAMTNQLLAQSLDMQKKIADNQPSWGNRFARVA
jgi:hypothetical protein